jgi:phosphorylase/glycogen(starch) synthase
MLSVMQKPDYIFETSWEICNKVGGIYTVIASKAKSITENFGDKYIVIGPDTWKGVTENPDFLPDPNLFSDWIRKAKTMGLNVRAGRWNISSRPIALLVDYTPFIAEKDLVFKKLWEDYKLDSISGGWDYIEPALFGYAAGKVIENFYQYYLGPYHQIIAHFHEWMTGAGVLYLEKSMPVTATVFTTHATVLGRSISGHGQELYEYLDTYEPNMKASELKVVSKHSLEQKAAQHADVFTTVSEITARECEQFLLRRPDVITINGFELNFVPEAGVFEEKRQQSRQKILDVASRLIGKELPQDTFMILNSGRYEFNNKGVDIFIDAIGNLKERDSKKEVLGVIALPAGTIGPLPQLVGDKTEAISGRDKFVTHLFNHMDYDPVLERIQKNDIFNTPEENTHIIFIPSYLDGRDGLFDIGYYDFLMGFDYTVFPSYYEPWGYTPLESVAFKIPTVTTAFSGFGKWVKENFSDDQEAVSVLDRSTTMQESLPLSIAEVINNYMLSDKISRIREQALEIAREAEWSSLIENYMNAWELALKVSDERKSAMGTPENLQTFQVKAPAYTTEPAWKKIMVKNVFPKELEPLKELVNNLWWTWNDGAKRLLDTIGAGKGSTYNPIRRIANLSLAEIEALIRDETFMQQLKKVHTEFRAYMEEPGNDEDRRVAYFSMEYGLHTSIKTYSGGLGVLAGDYLKQASDSGKNMIAIGLLYRYGYFKQQINTAGEQISLNKPQNFGQMPLEPVRDEQGKWVYINLVFPGRLITAKIWKLMVGRIPLYLMDTDIEQNNEEDRALTHHLYGGDREHRLKQELLLGFGGIRLIKKLNLHPQVYHSNEGHSAFIGIERIRELIEHHRLDFDSALEVVRSSTLFTTHTPVPAGHDTFKEDLVRVYLGHYPDYLGIDWNRFIGLGKTHPSSMGEEFSMSILAANLSQKINGVSKIHGEVSREMFQSLYPGYFNGEIKVGHVTNGVHYATWTDQVWKETYRELFGEQFLTNQYNTEYWEKIYELPDSRIWQNRKLVKRKLIAGVMDRIENGASYYQTNPKLLIRLSKNLTEDSLIVGFARRFATYKRATLLFNNLDRLANLVNQEGRKVIFLFAGKAHPADVMGQNLIKHIIEVSRMPQFEGKIIFLENYDMALGKLLTSGVDVWLNTPIRPLEASGTSGQKAILNGALNFSVLDGWWAEGYVPDAGWSLEQKKRFEDQNAQDQLDAAKIYDKFENEIIPAFFDLGKEGIPTRWIGYIKNNIAKICPYFTMQRMIDDYYKLYYDPLFGTTSLFQQEEFANARILSEWKSKIRSWWDEIKVENLIIPDSSTGELELESDFIAEINLSIPGLDMQDIGIEVLFGYKSPSGYYKIRQVEQLKPIKRDQDVVTFHCRFPLLYSGVHDYAFRVYPKHDLMASRMDFPLVKWL